MVRFLEGMDSYLFFLNDLSSVLTHKQKHIPLDVLSTQLPLSFLFSNNTKAVEKAFQIQWA